MTQFVRGIAIAAALAASYPVIPANAQQSGLKVKVPFTFSAGGKAFPSGMYHFRKSNGVINLTNGDGKATVYLPVITYIARSHQSDDHLLAFDRVGEERILSEVWLPNDEGAIVYAAKGEHRHDVVRLVAGQAK